MPLNAQNNTYPPNGPDQPDYAQGNTYRDLCLSSRNLDTNAFNPDTGTVDLGNADDNFFANGHIAGAQPGQTCMPMKNTPVNDLMGFTANPNLAFAWHMNMGLPASFNGGAAVTDATTADQLNALSGVYNWYNDQTLASYAQPVGGNLYCKDMLAPTFTLLPTGAPGSTLTPNDNANTVTLAKFRIAQLANCAHQYIIGRGIMPWLIYEPDATPLQEYLHPPTPGAVAGNPMEPAIRYCEPLIKGHLAGQPVDSGDAEKVYLGTMQQRDAGYAPVLHSDKYPWLSEDNDYVFSDELRQAWVDSLQTGTALDSSWGATIASAVPPPNPFPQSKLPCVTNIDPKVASPSPTPAPSPSPSQKAASGPPDYCLSIEKYNDPRNPFSPRQEFVALTDSNNNPLLDANGNPKPLTDRLKYGPLTSVDTVFNVPQPAPAPTPSAASSSSSSSSTSSSTSSSSSSGAPETETLPGYTAYSVMTPEQQAANPPVQCAIVPVDIMKFRQDKFNTCMSQRINKNMADWKTWMQDAGHYKSYKDWVEAVESSPDSLALPASPYTPVCATHYYETDDATKCQAQWSVQQCCAYAARPIAGTNFVKQRIDDQVRENLENADEKPLVEAHFLDPTVEVSNTNAIDNYRADVAADKALWQAALGNGAYATPADLTDVPKDSLFAYYTQPYFDPVDHAYMGNDMPYMVDWDTGGAPGQNPDFFPNNADGTANSKARYGVSFANTLGSAASAGVPGREGATEGEAAAALALAQEAHKPQFEQDWVGEARTAEIAGYGKFHNRLLTQAYNMRFNHLSCIPRYEVAFKQLSGDDANLARLGADIKLKNGANAEWPAGWRGYSSQSAVAGQALKGFPYVNNDNPNRGLVAGGLSNATGDDIIVYQLGGHMENGRLVGGVTYTGYVVGKYTNPNLTPSQACLTNLNACFDLNVASTSADYLLVYSMDGGKHLDAYGTSDGYGILRKHYIYQGDATLLDEKVQGNWLGLVQNHVLGAYLPSTNPSYNIGATPSCEDVNALACTMPADSWNNALVFRALPIPTKDGSPPDATLFNHNDCADADVIPPSETQTFVNAIPIALKCANDGRDPPDSWSSIGQGGRTGVGSSTFTIGSFCPPLCITSRSNGVESDCIAYGLQGTAWGTCSSSTAGKTGIGDVEPPPTVR